MNYSNTYNQIEKLFDKYGLEKLIEEPKQVSGGLMHKMYRVATEHNKYAVKEFNSSIMKRNHVIEHLINSEQISNALEEIVPVISAIQINNNPLLILDDKYYMIFIWLNGKSIFPPNISLKKCIQMGKLLGKIHSADIVIPGLQKETAQPIIYDWDRYMQLGHETNAEWVNELSQIIDDLKIWNKQSNEACNSLSSYLVLSHRDLDPKNVMWKGDTPYIIDWEAAGYVNPYQELLEVLNYWANNGSGELDKDKFKALFEAYNSIVGNHQINWNTVLDSGFSGMLSWLDYSFKRSLGIEVASINENKAGTEQVFGTIKSLKQYAHQTITLIDWLKD